MDISSPFGFAIRHFTHSKYDHAFVILDADKGTILEAQPHGARVSNISEYKGLPMVFSKDSVFGSPPTVTPVVLNALADGAKQFIGKPYGFLDIVYLGMTLGVDPDGDSWICKHVLPHVLDTAREICSQLVAAFGQLFHTDWRCGQRYTQLVTPGLLASRASM